MQPKTVTSLLNAEWRIIRKGMVCMNGVKCSKYEYPVLDINTKEKKFELNGKDISDATAINIVLDSRNLLGKVVVEFPAEIKFNGELIMNEESKKDIEKILSKTAHEIAVHEQ